MCYKTGHIINSRHASVIYFNNANIYGILINHFMSMDIMLPLELMEILACPLCKGELSQSEDGSSMRCNPCNRDYPVVEGIPVLLPEQVPAS